MFNAIRETGTAYFSRMYSLFDLMYIVQFFTTYVLINVLLTTDYTFEEFEVKANLIRYIGIFGTICLFLKFSYFLSLVDQIAPLIDIIFQIFFEMRYFSLVLFIYIFMFA